MIFGPNCMPPPTTILPAALEVAWRKLRLLLGLTILVLIVATYQITLTVTPLDPVLIPSRLTPTNGYIRTRPARRGSASSNPNIEFLIVPSSTVNISTAINVLAAIGRSFGANHFPVCFPFHCAEMCASGYQDVEQMDDICELNLPGKVMQ